MTARNILKALPKSGKDDDPKQFAALAKDSKTGKSISIVTTDGKLPTKTISHPVIPIDASFPNYREGIFPYDQPSASILIDPELLRSTIEAASLGESMKLHVWKDKIVLQSRNKDGSMNSRAVLMGLEGEAPPSYTPDGTKAAGKKKPAPAPEVKAAEEKPPTPAK